ncbi:hypothetical protein [Vibrio parahaemolyticus]|uniref:hypothetical protein n=1 Tax=Vibrio parahaemolyticus TaxID=670 RepID=UPI002362A8B8|nr:hypothetical protein [Vibrio parahaemolyticus]
MTNGYATSFLWMFVSVIIGYFITYDIVMSFFMASIFFIVFAFFSFKGPVFTKNLLLSFSFVCLLSMFIKFYTLSNFDVLQTTKDSEKFLYLLQPYYRDFSLEDLRYLVDSTIAVKIWQFFYFSDDTNPNIAITINSLLISVSIALIAEIKKILGGQIDDKYVIALILFSGIPLQFGVLLLRDSFIFLAMTILCYFHARWNVNKCSLFIYSLTVMFLSWFVLYLRDALAIIVIVFYVTSIAFRYTKNINFIVKFILFLLLFSVLYLVSKENVPIIGYAIERADTYRDLALSNASESSLGVGFIYNQPFLIRLVFASSLLILGTIPSWLGFIWGSHEYQIFLSIYSFFMIATFPTFLRGVILSIKSRDVVCFYSCWYLVGILMIASTSIEIRHVGQFFVFYIVSLLLFFNYFKGDFFKHYFNVAFYVVIGLVHFFWVAVKYL